MWIFRTFGTFSRRKITVLLIVLTVLVCTNFYFLSSQGKHLPLMSGKMKRIPVVRDIYISLQDSTFVKNSTEKTLINLKESIAANNTTYKTLVGLKDNDSVSSLGDLVLSTEKKMNELIGNLKAETNYLITDDTKEEYSEKSTERNDPGLLQNMSSTLNDLQENMKKFLGTTDVPSRTTDVPINQKKESSPCKVNSLTGKSEKENHPSSCKPHQSPREACEFANSLFYIDPSLQTCPDENIEICSVKVLLSKNGKYKLNISFNFSHCLEDEEIIASIANPKTGELEEYPFPSYKKATKHLPRIIRKTFHNQFNYVVLSCYPVTGHQRIRQLITFPHFPSTAPSVKPQNKININIILLDSVSRAHFYRSLPKTIATLQRIESDAKIPARAFDFELYQAIHGHTAENMHALFSGKLFPSHFTSKMREESPTRVDVFSMRSKNAGYQTTYQEDLCWKAVWGMMLELGANTWRELRDLVKENGIDNTGLTLAACEIYSANNIETPFNGPDDDKLCYNGKFHHTYYLGYLQQLFQAHRTQNNSAPLLTFTATQVGHDYTARRIQTADSGLAEFFNNMAHEEDTLTILLSDHGNTYSSYLIESLEGRFEMFHPAMFMIVPNKVAAKLGHEAVQALEQNQHRLLTLMDLHHALMPLAHFTTTGHLKPQGVFAPLPMNRTCNSIELSTPNICVCEGWDTVVKNDTSQIPFAEFAVEQLNEKIQKQYSDSKQEYIHGFGACEKLVIRRIENVLARSSLDGRLITTLDVVVQSSKLEKQQEIFQVQVKSTTDPHGESSQFELTSYNRISQYGNYRKCADPGVDVKLCICNNAKPAHRNLPHPKKWILRLLDRNLLGEMTVYTTVEKCVVFLLRNHTQTINGDAYSVFVYEMTNICPQHKFKIKFDSSSTNMKVSNKLPLVADINAWEIKFLVVAYPHVVYWSYDFLPIIDVLEKMEV